MWKGQFHDSLWLALVQLFFLNKSVYVYLSLLTDFEDNSVSFKKLFNKRNCKMKHAITLWASVTKSKSYNYEQLMCSWENTVSPVLLALVQEIQSYRFETILQLVVTTGETKSSKLHKNLKQRWLLAFCSSIKGMTPKMCMLCSVLINSVSLNLLRVCISTLQQTSILLSLQFSSPFWAHVSLIADLDHAAQLLGCQHPAQRLFHILFLCHGVWVADVSHVNHQVLWGTEIMLQSLQRGLSAHLTYIWTTSFLLVTQNMHRREPHL